MDGVRVYFYFAFTILAHIPSILVIDSIPCLNGSLNPKQCQAIIIWLGITAFIHSVFGVLLIMADHKVRNMNI